MKKVMLLIFSFILTSTVSIIIHADTTTTSNSTQTNATTTTPATQTDQSTNTMTPDATATPTTPDPKPCNAIKAACQAAGYFVGGNKTGKGLKKDCVKPILSGQTVIGVTVNPANIPACIAKHNAHNN